MRYELRNRRRREDWGAFNMRCCVNACRELARVFAWPPGYECKMYLKAHEVIVRVIDVGGGKPVCACVYWCQTPDPERT